MSLNSLTFLCVVLPASLVAYYLIMLVGRGGVVARTLAKVVLLAVSIFTYCWVAPNYLPHMLAGVGMTYVLALGVQHTKGVAKKLVTAVGVIGAVYILAHYKYLDFLAEELQLYLPALAFEAPGIVQPVGISFLIFSVISYLVDVYRGTQKADANLLNVALWVFFFAKVVSGPIVRYGQMFREGEECPARPNLDDAAAGARRFVIGMAKKVVIANTLGATADTIFALQSMDTPTAWLGAICYSLQLFFDFAGYSDMALGLGRMFGFRFEENFNYPYISKTVGEFWRRWHISLSSWLRDYLYFPLGGSRRGNVYVNLAIVFLISGLWHGAGSHFIVWGAWYAVFMIIDRLYRLYVQSRFKIPAVITWAFTMFVVVLGWVIFRADDMPHALAFLGTMFGGGTAAHGFSFGYFIDGRLVAHLVAAVVLCVPFGPKLKERFGATPVWNILAALGTVALFALSYMYIITSDYSPFLYAQF